MKKSLPVILLLALTGAASASQDDDFMAARQAFQSGNAARLETHARRLQGHVLEPYASYYQLPSSGKCQHSLWEKLLW